MIAAFRRTPAWFALPAVGLIALVGAATLTVAVSKAADKVTQTVTPPPAAAAPAEVKPGAAAVYSESADPETPANRAVMQKLDANIKELAADQTGLEKVLAFLRDNTGCNILVKWNALEAAGVDRNTPVSIQVTDVPFRKALKSVLEAVSSNVALGYVVDDGVITISTKEDLNASTRVMRVYNVRNLLAVPSFQSATAGSSTQPASEADRLMSVIRDNASPTTWMDNGGNLGSMQEFKGLLTITTTPEIHAEVAAILRNLRAADKEGQH